MGCMFFYVVLFSIGHIIAAIAVYLNHRFVFHGKLGRLPILRNTRKLHLKHHAHAYDDVRNEYFEPLWVKVGFYLFISLVGTLFSWAFALGLFSFGLLYSYRHKNIHNADTSSYFSIHHRYHHVVDPRYNYSGIYPSIDYLFGTASTQKKD
tara:strand:- start:698 stop:1150 length:453 start_codon:yes stop_codon:yes gene_type:complete